MPAMTFDYLSWEAFATLLTGALAVAAALMVGLRQAGIAERQAKIQNKQADISGELAAIEASKVKVELFDRRLEVFRAVDGWLRRTVQDGDPPGIGKENGLETRRRFETALITSQFLFRPEVHHQIEIYWKLGNDMHSNNQLLKARDGDVASRAAHHTELMQILVRSLDEFAELVRPELHLG